MPITKTVYDPLGNAIALSSGLPQLISIPNSDLCIDASLIISQPAMIFESTDGSFEKYYFRTVEWDNFVLITVKKVGENFITDHYEIPPRERILDLIKNCRQIK